MEKGTAAPPPLFGPCLLWPNGRPLRSSSVLTESFSDGDDLDNTDKWHHNYTETEVLHINNDQHQLEIQ